MRVEPKYLAAPVIGLGLAAILILAFASPTRAAEFRGGDVVVIKADEVIDDDLFVSGNIVEIEGTVTGDLFATGSEVTVEGQVGGSAFLSGYALTVGGDVEGSLYSGGYSLAVERGAQIGRNVYFGGFSLILDEGSSVGRSVYTGSYQTVVDGEVEGDVNASAAALVINGAVGGDVTGEVQEADGAGAVFPSFPGSVPIRSPGLDIGNSAEIGGEIDVQVTAADRPEPGKALRRFAGRTIQDRLGEFLAVLIIGGLLLWLWPAALLLPQQKAKDQPLPSTGWGCVSVIAFYVLFPIAAALLVVIAALGGLVTLGQLFGDILGIGGSTLALIFFAFTFVLSIVTKVVVAFLGGRWILDRLMSDFSGTSWANFGALALGIFIYEILRVIPFLGWLLSVVVTLVGLGAIALVLRNRYMPPKADAKAAA